MVLVGKVAEKLVTEREFLPTFDVENAKAGKLNFCEAPLQPFSMFNPERSLQKEINMQLLFGA